MRISDWSSDVCSSDLAVIMNQALQDLGEYLSVALGDDMLAFEIVKGELIIQARRDSIHRVLTLLRDDSNCQFKLLVDICGVDYPDSDERFDVVYNLLSLQPNPPILVKLATDEEHPVPSVHGAFKSAGGYERKAEALYGLVFSVHPDLRSTLT